MITTCPRTAIELSNAGEQFVVYNGDCRDLLTEAQSEAFFLILTSPPYFVGKKYDTSTNLEDFEELHSHIAKSLDRVVTAGGSVCWQVGNHIKSGSIVPLDFVVHNIFHHIKTLVLRNRIIWTFGHGVHARRRFSGRYETILWYSKGTDYYFDLDSARIPQKYRGKKHYKGPNKGAWSSNPAGKNPSDVWDIPNVKANHVEKTEHPCQFPIALAQRLVKALSPAKSLVFDPFCGVGSTGIAAVVEGRRFIGAELDPSFCRIAEERWMSVREDKLRMRPLNKPVYQPDANSSVVRDPFIPLEEELT